VDTLKEIKRIIAEVEENAPEIVKFPSKWEIKLYRNSPVAGKAYGVRLISINQDLAELYPEQLRDTVIHEMAHCLVFGTIPRRCKPHGPEWQHMMLLLGVSPEVCHRMEQPGLIRKRNNRQTWHCDCTEHYLTTTMHNKIMIKGQPRHCRRCKTSLQYGPKD